MTHATPCKSCGRIIAWLKTASGKNMPVDVETVQPTDDIFNPQRHVSHFATCPQADQHRSRR